MTALGLLAMASLVFVSATLAGPAASKQRIAMKVRSPAGSGAGTFTFTPARSGSLGSDAGTIKDTSEQQKHVVRAGQTVIVFTFTSTWSGKKGTMVLRDRFEDVAAKNGNRIGTGVWSLVNAKGTGQYAGLSGSGRSAYVLTPHGCCVLFRYQGSVTKP